MSRDRSAGEPPSPSSARHELLVLALALPEAWEDHPWGETVAKVGKKVFAFFGGESSDDPPLTVKLADGLDQALDLGGEPAGYGLGRSGWVTIGCRAAPIGVLGDFVEESYRLIAPKRLGARLDAGTEAGP